MPLLNVIHYIICLFPWSTAAVYSLRLSISFNPKKVLSTQNRTTR